MSTTVIQRSFGSGEIAPSLAMRADLAKYQSALRTCRNFIVQRHGGIANRAGLRLVDELAVNSANSRLIPYVSENAGESMLIEATSHLFRFFMNGGAAGVTPGDLTAWDGGTAYEVGDIVNSGGTAYVCILRHTNHVPPNATYWVGYSGTTIELVTPWADVTELKFHQSGRVITFTAPGVAPYELICFSLVSWVLRLVNTAPHVGVVQNPILSGTSAGARTFKYKITAAAPDSYEEGEPSASVIGAAVAAPTADAPHVISWDALTVDGVAVPEYYVYCDPYNNGSYGFLATASSNSLRNPGLAPDFAVSPPIPRILFATDFPTCSATFEQRRVFGSTPDFPDALYFSRTGFASNFGIASPLQDDDAVTMRIAGNNNHPVRHFASLKIGLVTLTDGGIWIVHGPEGVPISPNANRADQETYVGCANMPPPVVIGNGVIYVQSRGSIPREVKFDVQVEGLAGRDLTLFAAHLVDGFTIEDQAFALTPHSIAWFVRSDGTLLGLTYIPELDVWGWHRHDTDGLFEKVCVVPEPGEDGVYVIVRRVISGEVKRFIERLESRTIVDWNEDSFFVDCGLSYDGAPVSNISGLNHLEGEIVAIVGDGVVVFDGNPNATNAESFRVTGGAITGLPAAYSVIHAGLPIRYAEFETLDLDVAGSSTRDKGKRVNTVTLQVENSVRTFRAGPDTATLVPFRLHSSLGPDPFTGQAEIATLTTFTREGRTFVRHTDPLPLTVLGIMPSVEVGG